MTGKGTLSIAPHSRFRIWLAAQLSWIGIVCLLGAWWGRLLLRQAEEIARLESRLGLAHDFSQSHWHKTQRMLFWESFTFFGLLLISTGFLFWMYWRDAKRSKGLQAFFASVTHELRTPLAGIRLQAESIAENLQRENSLTDPQKKLVDRLLEDTLRLESQVERTLELARVEGGGPVHTRSLPLQFWLERFLKKWRADYQDKFEISCSAEDVGIEADPMALQIILNNIFENSLKHSRRSPVRIHLSTQAESQWVKLSIQDDGEGFQGETKLLGSIFQKGTHSQGTGVGLYLVKTLMKRMGGHAEFFGKNGFQVLLSFPKGKNDA